MSASGAGLLLAHSAELNLLEELRLWGGERLLFIGCGDGWLAEEAWRRIGKGSVCGVDRSPQLIAYAAEMRSVPGKLEFTTWDGRKLPYPDACFDCIVSRCDAENMADPLEILSEMRRVLRSGGELYLVGFGGTVESQLVLEHTGVRLRGTGASRQP